MQCALCGSRWNATCVSHVGLSEKSQDDFQAMEVDCFVSHVQLALVSLCILSYRF